MKRYSVLIAIHIACILLLCYTASLLYGNYLWWSYTACLLLALVTAIHLYRVMTRVLNSLNELIRTLPNDEVRRHIQLKNKEVREIGTELTAVLNLFHDRVINSEIRLSYYEALLNQVDTAVLACNQKGIIEWMNHAAKQLVGEKFQVPAAWLRPETEPSIASLPNQTPDTDIMMSCTRFITRNGERYLISLKNIQTILEHNEMEAWQKLIRVLTHEIMNSITPIISLSDTLCCRADNEPPSEKMYSLMRQGMQTIQRRSEGLMHFIENYRKLTRIPVPQPTPILLAELFDGLNELYHDPSIRFNLEARSDTLTADRNQVEQLLINLIKNAKEATAGQPTPNITVTASNTGGSITLSVSDNGKGILPDVQARIFMPFFTTKPEGSGIGLSLCKQIMRLHGGYIKVHSEAGKGCKFTLTFPPAPGKG